MSLKIKESFNSKGLPSRDHLKNEENLPKNKNMTKINKGEKKKRCCTLLIVKWKLMDFIEIALRIT